MTKQFSLVLAVYLSLALPAWAQGPRQVALGDWPEARGPNRDGISLETGLPDTWALNGPTLLSRVRPESVRARRRASGAGDGA